MLQDITTMFKPAPIMVPNTGVIYREEDISFLSKAISICLESRALYRQLCMEYMQEGTVLNEMFDNSTFLALIKAIIGCFIEGVKELVERFLSVFNTFTDSRAHIEKYAQQILAYDKPLKIPDFMHHKYTKLEADIPPSIINTKILDEHRELYGKLRRICTVGDKTATDIATGMSDFYNKTKADFKDKDIFLLRGQVVSINKGLSAELYTEELYKVFRNGMTTPIVGDIHQSEIHEAYRRWRNSKTVSKEIKAMEASIRANAEKVKKQIKDIRLVDITDGRFKESADLDNILANILRVECDKVSEMCTVVTLALGAKLDAVKEAAIQDKKVLNWTISAIIGA